jgi:3-oxoacyl-[acyl-carrier-protein] synthase-3
MGADGSGGHMLIIPSSGTKERTDQSALDAGRNFLEMDGRGVFKWAVTALTSTIELVLNKSGMSPHDVSLYVFHQANIRIINNAVEQLGIPADRVLINVHKYGNTSGASIPLALDEAHREGRLKQGDAVMMCGFGAGLTWGTALFRW